MNGGDASAGEVAGGAAGGGGESGLAGAAGSAGAPGGGSSSGTGGSGADGGGSADGGTGGAGGTGIQLGLPICSRAAVAGAWESLGLDAVLDRTANFTAITPDEFTLVWTVRRGRTLTVTYVDRSQSDAAFATSRSTDTDAGDDQVAVSPDGLQLVYVSADGQRFQVQTRADRTAEFAEATPVDFGVFADALSDGLRYAEPVYGPEGVSFYFATLDSSDRRVRFASTRPSLSDSFDRATQLELPGAGSDPVPRVTGVSADEQTLFLWDAATGQTLWAFLDASTFKYADPALLAEVGPAQPNAACSRLYAGPELGSVVRLPLE